MIRLKIKPIPRTTNFATRAISFVLRYFFRFASLRDSARSSALPPVLELKPFDRLLGVGIGSFGDCFELLPFHASTGWRGDGCAPIGDGVVCLVCAAVGSMGETTVVDSVNRGVNAIV
jgi:hypothetical protein